LAPGQARGGHTIKGESRGNQGEKVQATAKALFAAFALTGAPPLSPHPFPPPPPTPLFFCLLLLVIAEVFVLQTEGQPRSEKE